MRAVEFWLDEERLNGALTDRQTDRKVLPTDWDDHRRKSL